MTNAFYDLLLASLAVIAVLLAAADSNAQTRRPAQNSTQTDQSLLDGGQPETLAQCMSFWDPTTQMTKSEWRDTCQRTQNGLNPLGTSEQPIRDTTRQQRSRNR